MSRATLQAEELAVAEALVKPALALRIVPLDAPPAMMLRAAGEVLHAPRLLPDSGTLTALGCAVATIGPALEKRVGRLFAERRAALALALDDYGNRMLHEAARRAQDRLLAQARRDGLSMAGELRPGDPGLALEAQRAVVRLAGGEAAGVAVSGHILTPLKSVSMVFGVGIDLPPARWSRCDDCPTAPRCRLAQAGRSP